MPNIEILVVLLNHGQLEDELVRRNIDVVVLEESQHSGLSIIKNLYALAKKFQADIIHTHRYKENVMGGLIARTLGAKSIRTAHGLTELAELSDNKYSLMPLIANSLDKLAGRMLQQKIVAVSDELMRKLLNFYSAKKLEVIENGVDIQYIVTRADEACSAHIEQDDFNVAFVGRFVPVKRIDMFCAIARSVIENRSSKQVRFHLFGDGPLKQEVESLIANQGLSTEIRLHGFAENVAPMLKRMDLLVFTSDHEGLPMTLLEAMALGVPVLSRNLPTIRKVLCDGRCGIFPESDSIDDFAKTILNLVENEEVLMQMTEMAKSEVYEKYDIEMNAKRYLDLYRSLFVRK